MISCNVIATGSTGNAVLLNGRYLIDCGVPGVKLDQYLQDLRLVFLTHEHGDHYNFTTVRWLHMNRPSLLFVVSPRMAVRLQQDLGFKPETMIVVNGLPVCLTFPDETIEVSSFETIHNVPNVGWCFKITGGSDPGTAMYATDTQYIPVDLPGLDLYMVEANYRVADLEARIAEKEAQGIYPYEKEVAQNHMSEETVKAWLRKNMGDHSRAVFLHQHIERRGKFE